MKFAKMFGFLSLNRIFFSRINNLHCLTQRIRASLSVSLPGFLLALLLGILAVLIFPSRSFSVSLAATDTPLAESRNVSTDQLDQFAQAYLQVLKLLSDRQNELPADQTSPAALEIQQSIEADTINIIQSSGLTLPEYMQILDRAIQDETFQRQIFDRPAGG